MPTIDTQEPRDQLEKMPDEGTSSRVVQNLLKNVKAAGSTYNAIDSMAIHTIGKPQVFAGSDIIRVEFMLGETADSGGFHGFPISGGLNSCVLSDIRSQGFDIEGKGMTFTLTLSADKFRELSEKSEDANRGKIGAVLDASKESQQNRIATLETLIGKEVANDSSLVAQDGTLKVLNLPGGNIGIRLQVNGSTEAEMEGGVIIDTETGEVTFHPTESKCNRYLQDQFSGKAAEIADDFIRQLQTSR